MTNKKLEKGDALVQRDKPKPRKPGAGPVRLFEHNRLVVGRPREDDVIERPVAAGKKKSAPIKLDI